MNDFAIVEVLQTGKNIPKYEFDLDDVEGDVAFDELAEVAVTMLHHKVHLIEALQLVGHDHLNQSGDVRMVQLLQKPELTKQPFAVDGIVEHAFDALDRNRSIRASVIRFGYLAIAALADEFLELVVWAWPPIHQFVGLRNIFSQMRCFLFRGLHFTIINMYILIFN